VNDQEGTMNIRRTMNRTAHLAFVALAVTAATACTQAVDDSSGTSSSLVSGTVSGTSGTEAGRPRPRFLLADVVDAKGTHALVPFALPEPPKDAPAPGATPTDAPKPPPCMVHRTTADEASLMPPPPKDGAPMPPPPDGSGAPAPDAPKDGDAKPGPVMLQIAVFASEADATAAPPKEGETPVKPIIVVQCFGAPGEKRVDVPKDVLDGAFAGLADGATARIALAGFPMPPPPPPGMAGADSTATPPPPPPGAPTTDTPMGPPPPMGRGLFGIAALSDTSAIDSLLTTLALP
jgi:hypothetical protein